MIGVVCNILRFYPNLASFDIEVQWFNKGATRMAEASWLLFTPLMDGQWVFDVMGEEIDPLDVVENGNRKWHAVNERKLFINKFNSSHWISDITNHMETHSLRITTWDAPLVVGGEPDILAYKGKEYPDLAKGVHFNLQ